MAFTTLKGFTHSQTDADGLIPFGEPGYTTMDKTIFRNTLKELLQGGMYQGLAGVLAGGVCTAATNVVTIPANTYYIAGGVGWFNASAHTESVADGTLYLWGCSDGEIHTSSDTTPPTGFTTRTACIITKAVTTGGVAVLDNSVQQRARTADGTNRIIGENAKVFAPVLDTIPAGFVGVVPSGSQYVVHGKLTLSGGKLTLLGKLRLQG